MHEQFSTAEKRFQQAINVVQYSMDWFLYKSNMNTLNIKAMLQIYNCSGHRDSLETMFYPAEQGHCSITRHQFKSFHRSNVR